MKTATDQTEEMLSSILNGMSALITVCDHKTFDVLFLNEAIRNKFGVKDSDIGGKCYNVLQKLDAPCPGCPYDTLSFDKVTTWEHHDLVTGSILLKSAKLIKWPFYRTAHLEYAIDITDLRNEQKKNRKLAIEANKIYFDPLTNIYNRYYLEKKITSLLHGMFRSNDILSVMVLDIDFFKEYNDTYGHLEGDTCLVRIAQIIQNSLIRASDFVCRFGGEEFVVVLPNTDEPGAKSVAERILENLAAAKLPHLKSKIEDYVTLSIGIASGKAQSQIKFLEAADKMLYKSKTDGRNRYNSCNLSE